MTSQSNPLRVGAAGQERRRHKRYEVEWNVNIEFDGEIYHVTVSDVSVSGALVLASSPPPIGEYLKLELPGYGWIGARIVHASDDFCGIEFTDPAKHRDSLARWLSQELVEGV